MTVGAKIFIRTVTNYYTGQVSAVDANWVTLTDAAWIPNTGRFGDFISSGAPSEVEPYPDGVALNVSLSAIIDWCSWPAGKPLPRAVL